MATAEALQLRAVRKQAGLSRGVTMAWFVPILLRAELKNLVSCCAMLCCAVTL